MMNISKSLELRCLILDDHYGKINSHWPYSTSKMKIVSRIYYDEEKYVELVEKSIMEDNPDVICYSGRLATEIAKTLDKHFDNAKGDVSLKYTKALKVMKIHNTNLSEQVRSNQLLIEQELQCRGNDWVKLAINHPFDVIFVQTYGDAEIFNRINQNKKAVWVPYSYNDQIYFDRGIEKTLDIGAFFKIERHSHRIEFIKQIERFANNYGYSFEFSDQYWGEEYAKKISEAKVIVHLSYCGDIPWRLYECAASGTCFVTDQLKFGVEKLFPNKSYIEYKRDFSDFEFKLKSVLDDDTYRRHTVKTAKKVVIDYAWNEFADCWIAPIIYERLKEKRGSRCTI